LGVLSRPALTRIKAQLTHRATRDQHATVPPQVDPLHDARKRKEYLSAFCDLANVQWPKNRTLTIVCHGHSVPAGYFKTPDVQTFQAYPHLLHAALSARFPFAVINVIVTAIGGEASLTGAERFERDVLSLHPDIVTIDYGLNDRGVGLHAARNAWASMIEQAQRKDIKVILLTPTPDTSAQLFDSSDPLNQHAAQIRALAAEYNVGLVDSLAAFSDAISSGRDLSQLMSQPNHPNRAGHDLVAQNLLKWFPTKP
jgi:lysophospholipase L1-like esterase